MTAGGWWRPAYVGVGSNLDGPVGRVRDALVALRDLPETASFVQSGLYRSGPVGPPDQPDFINAVAAFLTRLDGPALMARLKALEAAGGRTRSDERWGPRTLDLDLLVLGQATLDEPGLRVPHPRIAERNFVLLPLAEIAPHLRVPGHGSVLRLLAAVAGSPPRIERLTSRDAAT